MNSISTMHFNIISKNPQIIELPATIFNSKAKPIFIECDEIRAKPIFIGYNEVIDDDDDIQQIIVLTNKGKKTGYYGYSVELVVIAMTTKNKYIYLKNIGSSRHTYYQPELSGDATHATISHNILDDNKILIVEDVNSTGRYTNGVTISKSIIVSYDNDKKKYEQHYTAGYIDQPYQSKYIVLSKNPVAPQLKAIHYDAQMIDTLKNTVDILNKQIIQLQASASAD